MEIPGLTGRATITITPARGLALKLALAVAVFGVIIIAPTPSGLTDEGHRALAIMGFAVVLWASEAIPIALTGLISMLLLVLLNVVPDVGVALHGFSQPVAYFIIGILTLGMAVRQSGLAERLATYMIRMAGKSPRTLYMQMLVSFAALTFALPSASTRGAIMVHIYEQVMDHWRVDKEAPLNQAVMLAMATLNRLGSTALLAGGITPVVASGLLGDFSWTRWFVLMSVPFYIILAIGGILIYLTYRSGFRLDEATDLADLSPGPLTTPEIKAGLITLGTALLWFTDFAHGLHPVVPALIAMSVILTPGVGLLEWREFERGMSWSSFFVIATSLSMANAIITTGAAAWFSDTLVGSVESLRGSPMLLLLVIAIGAALVRLVVPNISGYLALVIPVAMSTAEALGLSPLVFGMAVVLFAFAVPYWNLIGESLIP